MSAKLITVENWPGSMGKDTQRILGIVPSCSLDHKVQIAGNESAADDFAVHALKSQLAVFGDTDSMRSRICPIGPRFSHELRLELVTQQDEAREAENVKDGTGPQTFMAESSGAEDWYPKSDAEV